MKTYQVWHNGLIQQHLNRYFVTKGGAYLYKSKDGVKMLHMMKDTAVQLFNDYYEVPFEDYNINYAWYISKTKEILNELEPNQLTLL